MSRRTSLMVLGFLCILAVVILGDFINSLDTNKEYIDFDAKELSWSSDEDLRNRNLGIIIEIDNKLLYLIDMDNNEIIKKYVVATGTKETPSPTGSFKIVQKAMWGSGFGTRWLGLNVPCPTCDFGIRNTRIVGIKGLVL